MKPEAGDTVGQLLVDLTPISPQCDTGPYRWGFITFGMLSIIIDILDRLESKFHLDHN